MKKRWSAGIAVCVAAGMIVNGCGQTANAPSGDKAGQQETTVSGSEQKETAEEGTESQEALYGASESEDGFRLADDYYEYMNHTFLEDVEVPADSSQWNYFYELENTTAEILDAILSDTVENREQHEPGSGEQKITDLYLTAIDFEEREAVGFGELAMYLDRIVSAGTVQQLLEGAAWAGKELKIGGIFTLIPEVDMGDRENYAVYLLRPELGPGKEILEDGSRTKKLEEYTAYVSDILKLYGKEEGEAQTRAAEIVAFQKAIAAVSLPDEEMWNPENVNNRYTWEELQELFGGIDMGAVFAAAGIDAPAGAEASGDSDNAPAGAEASGELAAAVPDVRYIVMEPEAERCLAGYFTEENLPILKDYAAFCLIDRMAPYLAPSVRDRKLAYLQKGEVQEDRLAADMTQDLFADEFGRIYVELCFSEDSKKNVEAMVEKIVAEYQKRIETYDWLSRAAKETAKEKLEQMEVKAGYPDKWPSELAAADILPKEEGGSLVHNVLEVIRARTSHDWELAAGPVDRARWQTAPQTVTAYYDRLCNELVLPAAVLQAPFYDKNGTEAENLGGIGMIIAHEVIHAFDAAGSLYDDNGNSAGWWTDEDYEGCRKMEIAIEEYYSAIETFDGGHIDGRHTLEENMADLGAIACVTAVVGDDQEALRHMYERYAQTLAWKSSAGNGVAYKSVDDRAPAKVRVNGVLGCEAGFYEAYPGIGAGDEMYVEPAKHVGIW